MKRWIASSTEKTDRDANSSRKCHGKRESRLTTGFLAASAASNEAGTSPKVIRSSVYWDSITRRVLTRPTVASLAPTYGRGAMTNTWTDSLTRI